MISSLIHTSHHVVITAPCYDTVRTLPLNTVKLKIKQNNEVVIEMEALK